MEKNEAHKIGEIMAKSIMGKDFVVDSKNMNMYVYNLDISGSGAYRGYFDSKECAFKAAEKNIGDNLKSGRVVWIGEAKRVEIPDISIDDFLESIYERLYEEVGGIAYDYMERITKDDKEELRKELNIVFREWIERFKYMPECYCLLNKEEYVFDGDKWNLKK